VGWGTRAQVVGRELECERGVKWVAVAVASLFLLVLSIYYWVEDTRPGLVTRFRLWWSTHWLVVEKDDGICPRQTTLPLCQVALVAETRAAADRAWLFPSIAQRQSRLSPDRDFISSVIMSSHSYAQCQPLSSLLK